MVTDLLKHYYIIDQSASQTVDYDSIPGQVKPKTIKIGIVWSLRVRRTARRLTTTVAGNHRYVESSLAGGILLQVKYFEMYLQR